MNLEVIIDQISRIMARKVRQDQRAPPILEDEIEKKVDYILSDAHDPLVFNHDDFLRVKAAFINRVRSNNRNLNYDLMNRISELLGGRRTYRRRKSRRTRKYKK